MAQNDEQTEKDASVRPSFGAELRREREMREISIREISETTKISTRFLEAIEAGDFTSLPAPVFTRGFIREYASYLGLDPEEAVDRYMRIVAREEERLETEEAEMRERISGRFSVASGRPALRWIIVAVLALAALGIAVYFLSISGGEELEPEEKPPVTSTAAEEPVEVEPAEPAQAESIEMTLSATADSWINMQIDDQAPFEFTLVAGSSRDFDADEKIVFLTVGNAGGVNVSVNGSDPEPLGRVNQVVRDVEFDLAKVSELLRQPVTASDTE